MKYDEDKNPEYKTRDFSIADIYHGRMKVKLYVFI